MIINFYIKLFYTNKIYNISLTATAGTLIYNY